jgi:hypothetical protein
MKLLIQNVLSTNFFLPNLSLASEAGKIHSAPFISGLMARNFAEGLIMEFVEKC